jgi:hypothetical protein
MRLEYKPRALLQPHGAALKKEVHVNVCVCAPLSSPLGDEYDRQLVFKSAPSIHPAQVHLPLSATHYIYKKPHEFVLESGLLPGQNTLIDSPGISINTLGCGAKSGRKKYAAVC